MSSDIGINTAVGIVSTDTVVLIDEANNIVKACSGPNCNVAPSTRDAITKRLASVATEQANYAVFLFSIPVSSILARNIHQSYLELAAAVSSVYSFQCGDDTVKGGDCTINSSAVTTAQNNLVNTMSQPATVEINHMIVLSILAIIGLISIFLFFVFMLIGLLERANESTVTIADRNSYIQTLPETRTSSSVFP
jgi:hypothetical protein